MGGTEVECEMESTALTSNLVAVRRSMSLGKEDEQLNQRLVQKLIRL